MTLDGTRMTGHFGPQTLDVIYVTTPSHAAGTVNLAVTNPDGQSAVMADAFTYASPGSFDFNGTWSGYVFDGSEEEVRITIQNNMVTGVSCKGWERTFSPSPAIENGEFSFLGADGEAIFGRIVSASEAVGTIKIASCAAPWRAGKLSR